MNFEKIKRIQFFGPRVVSTRNDLNDIEQLLNATCNNALHFVHEVDLLRTDVCYLFAFTLCVDQTE